MQVENDGRPGDKREAILQATLALIAERSIQDTPMSLIAKRSKASAGVIYRYFPGQAAFLEALYARIKGGMGRAWIVADDRRQPPTKRFHSVWLVIFRYCIAHPQEMAFVEQYESLRRTK